MDETTAIEEGRLFFVKKRGLGENKFELFLKNTDYCGNSFSGQFDYHWTYETYEEATEEGQRLVKVDNDER